MTLLEMLATITIMAVTGAGIAGLLMLNNMTGLRLSNKVESINNARQVIERIGKDVRMARNIGDVFGESITFAGPPPYTLTLGSNYFPSPNDPKVFRVVTDNGQPTSWPWGAGPNTPLELSTNTLIVQVPVFDAQGFPTRIEVGAGNPPTTVTQDNVDTLVYKVVPDPDIAGTWKLQVAGFPGVDSSLKIVTNPPTTLLRGIVGPVDPETGIPGPFQYIDRTDPGGHPKKAGDGTGQANANLTGVQVGFELKAVESSGHLPSRVAIKSEVYMRNNALSTVNTQQ